MTDPLHVVPPRPEFEVIVERNVPVTVRDGVTLATDIFHGAILEMGDFSDRDDNIFCMAEHGHQNASMHSFNESILCCVPKKPKAVDPVNGPIYDASCTRPLTLVNTDNRIIASAARIC